jgi:hypothetical protein
MVRGFLITLHSCLFTRNVDLFYLYKICQSVFWRVSFPFYFFKIAAKRRGRLIHEGMLGVKKWSHMHHDKKLAVSLFPGSLIISGPPPTQLTRFKKKTERGFRAQKPRQSAPFFFFFFFKSFRVLLLTTDWVAFPFKARISSISTSRYSNHKTNSYLLLIVKC